jgi:hypothetical protein
MNMQEVKEGGHGATQKIGMGFVKRSTGRLS